MSVEKRLLEARRWLAQAWDDWEAGTLLLEGSKHAQAAFLAQQAGEKALKALYNAQAILKALEARLGQS